MSEPVIAEGVPTYGCDVFTVEGVNEDLEPCIAISFDVRDKDGLGRTQLYLVPVPHGTQGLIEAIREAVLATTEIN